MLENRNIKEQFTFVAKENQGETFHKLAQFHSLQNSQSEKGIIDMRHSTKDLHEKYLSGYTLDEIGQNTGIGKWALYKRFQRMKKVESPQGNDFEDDVTPENIISIPDKSQTRTSKWTCAVCSLLILATVVMEFFLYRKYHTARPSEETK